MKVYTKIVYDKDDNVIEQHSYDYDGPVSHARIIPKYRASKSPTSKIKTIDEQYPTTSRSKAVNDKNDKIKKNFYDNDANFTAGGTTAADYNAQEDYRSRQYDNSDGNNRTTTSTDDKRRQVVDISEPNQLFKYASYNVLFTLSALGQRELENTKLLMQSAPHDIIARSSGIGPDANKSDTTADTQNNMRNVAGSPNDKIINASGNERLKGALEKSQATLGKNRDIYFKSVNMNAIPGPNQQRRLTGVTQIKMELIEPAGISLLEKVRGAAFNNGYLDHLDAPFLLTMNFAGFDELGNPITDKVKGSLDRRIPIKLVDMDMSVTSAGTSYTLTAIPTNETPYVNRYNWPRTTGKLSLTNDNTLGGVVKELEKALNKQNQDEADQGLIQHPDVYEISINKKLRPEVTINTFSIDQAGMFVTQGTGPRNQDYLKFNQNNAITKILEEIMKGHPDFTDDKFEDFKKKNTGDQTPVSNFTHAPNFDEAPTESFYYNYFRIKGSVVPTSKFDMIRNKNVKKIIYTIEPYKVHAMSLAIPGASTGQAFKNFVHKKYNYIFTGENTDIMDLDIKYRVAYFQSRLKNVDSNDSRKINIVNQDNVGKATGGSTAKGQGSDGNLLLGSEVSDVKSGTAGKTGGTAPVLDAFLDSLTHPLADMVVVRMTILGDPAYLGQSQFIPATPQASGSGTHTDTNMDYFHGSSDKVWNSKLHCFNADLAEPVVLLKFRMPTDINDQTGVYDMRSDQSAEFSGLYRVVQVEHSFDSGRYTNLLTMTRFNNQGVDVSDPQASIAVGNKLISTSEFDKIAKTFASGTFDDLTNSVKRKFKDKLSSILNK